MATLSMIPQIYCKTSNKHNRVLNVLDHQTERTNSQINVGKNVRIKILDGCKVWISNYRFDYNGEGGRCTGSTRLKATNSDNMIDVQSPLSFEADIKTVHIPPVTSATATIDGWAPFPPFVKVDVVPELMHGKIYKDCGKVELKLRAKICVSIGSSYKAPPLLVDTVLTSEGTKHKTVIGGSRLGKDGKCKLVGITTVSAVEDNYLNSVLSLPSQCVTSLNATIFLV